MEPLVSIIMPVYRSDRAVLAESLQALVACDWPRREILIIENDEQPQPELRALAESFGVTFLTTSARGAHEARNLGLKRARGELCFFVDDDVVVDRDCVRVLVERLRDPTVGAAGGRIKPLWRGAQPPWMVELVDTEFVDPSYIEALPAGADLTSGGERINFGLLSLLDLGDAPLDVDENWIYSCHMMVRRETALAARGFGPDLVGTYAIGDNEEGILRRIAAGGLRLVYDPAAVVRHVIPARRMTMRYFAVRVRNDGTCAAYVELREKGAPPPPSLAGRAGASLGRAAWATLRAARAAATGAPWRGTLLSACAHLGYSHYYWKYLTSREHRELVHRESYLDG